MGSRQVLHVVPAALLDHLGKLLAALRTLANDDLAVILGIEDVPALMLAERAVLVLAGVVVVGVNLDGKVVKRVEDLDQQGEAVALSALEELVVLAPKLGESLAVVGTAINGAVAVGVRGDAPALAHGTIGQLIAELRKADVVVQDGLEHNQANSLVHITTPSSLFPLLQL